KQIRSAAAKFPPALTILSRLRWDAAFCVEDYLVVYLDRHTGYQSVAVEEWKGESSDEGFVPQHRISAFVDRRSGEVVWHRGRR
ncbi:hypothetical protein K402DRAFT_310483, partial [Aulographum hederae CBS 113979]